MKKYVPFCIMVLCLMAASSATIAVSYAKYDLGLLPGTAFSEAFGVNNKGQVVGRSGAHAFIWDTVAGMQDLGGGHAYTINEYGQAAGFSTAGACYWNETSGRVDLGLGNSDFAYGINDLGAVVGDYLPQPESPRNGFVWDPDTGFTALDVIPGHTGNTPLCVNNQGQAVGYSRPTTGGLNAFIWNPGSGTTVLTADGWNLVSAQAINDSGAIAGYGYNPYSQLRGYLLDSTGIRGLTVLDGGCVSMAYGINNAGQVVGISDTEMNGKTHAIVWDANGDMHDLGFGRARAINDSGWIVGTSENHATLWIPVPEPGCTTCLLAGFGGLGLMIRRR